jgi:hypothetical protein
VFEEGENRLWAAVGRLSPFLLDTDWMANAIMYSGPRGICREKGQDFVKAGSKRKKKKRRSLMNHRETLTFSIPKLPQPPKAGVAFWRMVTTKTTF